MNNTLLCYHFRFQINMNEIFDELLICELLSELFFEKNILFVSYENYNYLIKILYNKFYYLY